jgi:hypothetical protein
MEIKHPHIQIIVNRKRIRQMFTYADFTIYSVKLLTLTSFMRIAN